MRRLLILLPLLLLAACGFQLRGEARLPAEFSPIHVEAADLDSAERSLLRSELERAGARIAEQPEGANRLWIGVSPLARRAIASSRQSSLSLWRVEIRLDYRLQAPDGKPLIPAGSLTESASIELDDDNPLTARTRLEQLAWRLRQALIRQLVFRLGNR
jgi:LPS-assembly lipoprotein